MMIRVVRAFHVLPEVDEARGSEQCTYGVRNFVYVNEISEQPYVGWISSELILVIWTLKIIRCLH